MSNSQNRKSRRIFLAVWRFFSLHILRLSVAHFIWIIGVSLVFLSLGMDWFAIPSLSIPTAGPFHPLLGRIWLLFLILCLGNCFLLLSTSKKEQVKQQAGIQLQDSTLMMTSGIIIALMAIGVGISISHYSIFAQDALAFRAPIFACIGGIFIWCSGYFLYRQERSFILTALFVENKLKQQELLEYDKILHKKENEKNMSLPF